MKHRFQNNENNFIITGYTSQQDVGSLKIRGKVYKYLKVYTKEKKLHTYYFPEENADILNDVINAPSTMMRNGRVIGEGKVKGVCFVAGAELSDDEVVIYEVVFLPRFIPKNILKLMNNRTILSDDSKEVKEIGQRKFMIDIPTEDEVAEEEFDDDQSIFL